MFDKIMYKILEAIDDFFIKVGTFFIKEKKSKKQSKTFINKNDTE